MEKEFYYYGGDHGEEIHDGNFCKEVDWNNQRSRKPHVV